MKTLYGGFQSHLDLEVTTTCYCWKVVRADGVIKYYTDHDAPITFLSNVYSPIETTFSRTNIAQSSELNVDNLELEVLLGDVSDDDLRAGVYDTAEIYLYQVNWADPTQYLKAVRGTFGEASIDEGEGKAKIELRGMLQAVQQPILKITSPVCRADFGDAQCGFDSSTLATTGSTANPFVLNYMDDYSIASGLPSGWTGRWSGSGGAEVVASHGGQAIRVDGWFSQQRAASYDAMDALTEFEVLMQICWIGTSDFGNDNAFVCFDMNGTWANKTGYMLHSKKSGSNADLQLWRWNSGVGASTGQHVNMKGPDWVYGKGHLNWIRVKFFLDGSGNRRIKVKTWYNTDSEPSSWEIDYTDSGALATGWKGIASDDNSTEADIMSMSYTEAYLLTVPKTEAESPTEKNYNFIDPNRNEDTGYWNNGVITFTSGNNLGFKTEVKSWDNSTKIMSLWEPAPYIIEYGDTYSVTPGCDKTLATCRDTYDNVLNFRGEPYLPGWDAISKTPDYSNQGE